MFSFRATARRWRDAAVARLTPRPTRARRRPAVSIDKAQIRYRVRGIYLATRRTLSSVLIDRRRGIDTAAEVDLEAVGLGHPERVRYGPTSWFDLHRALRALDLLPDDVFLDYGSGKGRVLLAAARLPYRRVIGLEISPELCTIARTNLDRDRARRRCGAIEIVAADVTAWDMPDDVTVVFMHNPFRGETIDAAVAQLLASLDRRPRPLRLVYRIPMEHQRLVATHRARLVHTMRGVRPGRRWSGKMATHVYELLPASPTPEMRIRA
jgi:SAM-dependent methyltransferase